MPHSFGIRARTRDLFCKEERGKINLTTYLREYKLGDHVDVKADGSVHKGMPHKVYHGKTGVVWNVSRRSIGVLVNKKVGGRVMAKKIHVRVEHCKPSRCDAEFKARVNRNKELTAKWKKEGGPRPQLKRLPKQPRQGGVVDLAKAGGVRTLEAEAYINYFV